MKLSQKEAKFLFELDSKISELYEKKKQVINKLKVKYPGGAQAIYKDESLEKPWVRTSLINNDVAYLSGEDVFRVARFSQWEIKVETLKHEPKEKSTINSWEINKL